MGKFDKYQDRPFLPGSSRGVAVRPGLSDELARIEEQARKTAAAGGPESASQAPAVAIALDATGSMHALLQSAKDGVGDIMRRAAAELGKPLEVEFFVYRDYDVPDLLRPVVPAI